MCGIAFTDKVTPVTRKMMPLLGICMEKRGDDSWGISDGNTVIKFDHEISKNIHPVFNQRLWNNRPLLIHTRAASVGPVSQPNAHPFDYTGKLRVVGIHNGSCSNWQALNTKYGRDFEVDSMHIFRHLADNLDPGELHMRGVIAWIENNDGILRFARASSTSIYIAQLDTGEFIGCSEEEPIRLAAKLASTSITGWWKVEDEEKYSIDGGKLYRLGGMRFWKTIVTHTVVDSRNYRRGRNVGVNSAFSGSTFIRPKEGYTRCGFCGGNLVPDLGESVICQSCLRKCVEHKDYVIRRISGFVAQKTEPTQSSIPLASLFPLTDSHGHPINTASLQ